MTRSKSIALGAMILIVVMIIIAMCMRVVSSIWEYSVLFLAFMSVFCHLASVMVARMSNAASRKLDIAALIFGILGVVALIVVFILDWSAF